MKKSENWKLLQNNSAKYRCTVRRSQGFEGKVRLVVLIVQCVVLNHKSVVRCRCVFLQSSTGSSRFHRLMEPPLVPLLPLPLDRAVWRFSLYLKRKAVGETHHATWNRVACKKRPSPPLCFSQQQLPASSSTSAASQSQKVCRCISERRSIGSLARHLYRREREFLGGGGSEGPCCWKEAGRVLRKTPSTPTFPYALNCAYIVHLCDCTSSGEWKWTQRGCQKPRTPWYSHSVGTVWLYR